ncbi:hypothetical protein ACXWOD_09295, partial [Streptococcus pyogenes]
MRPIPKTQRVRAFLNAVDANAREVSNQFFGEMYRTAVHEAVRGNTILFEFLSQLEHMPVDIETFIDSPEFLGATDLEMWPEVRKAIVEENEN